MSRLGLAGRGAPWSWRAGHCVAGWQADRLAGRLGRPSWVFMIYGLAGQWGGGRLPGLGWPRNPAGCRHCHCRRRDAAGCCHHACRRNLTRRGGLQTAPTRYMYMYVCIYIYIYKHICVPSGPHFSCPPCISTRFGDQVTTPFNMCILCVYIYIYIYIYIYTYLYV